MAISVFPTVFSVQLRHVSTYLRDCDDSPLTKPDALILPFYSAMGPAW